MQHAVRFGGSRSLVRSLDSSAAIRADASSVLPLRLLPGRRLATSSHSNRPTRPPRTHRLARASAVIGAVGLSIWALDRTFNARALERTARAGFYAGLVAADFKLNFREGMAPEQLDALHERVARRLHWVVTENAGLWIKFGQALGQQAFMLPKPYREAFANIFDAAPTISYAEVDGVFQREFGKSADELFDTFDHEPIASASIAQVHKATLDGKTWAVKIQRPAIAKQTVFDLWGYRTLLRLYQWWFDMPIAFIGPYVSSEISKETDFKHEAANSERTRELIAHEPSLAGKVLIPAINWERTTERVMTAEFVDACKLTDRERLDKMGLKYKAVMDVALNFTSASIFRWGHMHSDIHPGNVLVRRHPDHPSQPQIVVIDHGLYIDLPEEFRRQYCRFWKSLFVADFDAIDQIVRGWGIANSELFASATLLRPFKMQRGGDQGGAADPDAPKKSQYELQKELKARLRSMFEAEELIPRQLVFLVRTMRMANNQTLGSPSNRIQLLAHWAAAGLDDTMATQRQKSDLSAWLRDKRQVVTFQLVLLSIDVVFWLSKVRQWFIRATTGRREGFEDALQEQIAHMAKDQFGVELDAEAFEG